MRGPERAPSRVRALAPDDRAAIARLVARDGLFTPDEIAVALELVDAAVARPDGDYRVLVAEAPDGAVAGYVCYGPTPMTDGTFDLYWIVTDPERRGRGVARALVVAMEAALRAAGGRMVRVETSISDGYGEARRFYERIGYPVVATLPDFYRAGDDLLILVKRL
jgi:ribosomal protein S18 acetylase RimI-like enzyme